MTDLQFAELFNFSVDLPPKETHSLNSFYITPVEEEEIKLSYYFMENNMVEEISY